MIKPIRNKKDYKKAVARVYELMNKDLSVNSDVSGLSKILGSKSRASEILNKKRKLSLAMIRTVSKKLNIPAESLIKAY